MAFSFKEAKKLPASIVTSAIKKADVYMGWPNQKPAAWEAKKWGKVLRRIK